MSRVIHFEVTAEDPERAARFYAETFGWEITKWDGPVPYWLVETGEDTSPGINGGITIRHGVSGHVNTIGVENLEEASTKISAGGGSNEVPRQEIPGVGSLAYFRDTENNLFAVLEPFDQK